MKEMFRDVIQTVMEVELDEGLGQGAASGRKHQARPITARDICFSSAGAGGSLFYSRCRAWMAY